MTFNQAKLSTIPGSNSTIKSSLPAVYTQDLNNIIITQVLKGIYKEKLKYAILIHL